MSLTEPQLDESVEMRLDATTAEKRKYNDLAELFAILQGPPRLCPLYATPRREAIHLPPLYARPPAATEHLETAYIRDLVTPEQYKQHCNK
jgi:hypothetical protein